MVDEVALEDFVEHQEAAEVHLVVVDEVVLAADEEARWAQRADRESSWCVLGLERQPESCNSNSCRRSRTDMQVYLLHVERRTCSSPRTSHLARQSTMRSV